MGSNKCIQMTKAEFNRKIKEAKDETLSKALILFISSIMDNEKINCDEDMVYEIYTDVFRYSDAIKDHLITINNVSKIIEERTGMGIGKANLSDVRKDI